MRRRWAAAGNVGPEYLLWLGSIATFMDKQLLNIGSLKPLSGLLHLHSDAAQPLAGLSDRANVTANSSTVQRR
ncbi:hypothetical protein D2E51_04855 [Mycobacteroides abscessus]|nr:hypothetical protein DDT53_06695 [Mycobacteroides abscessus]QCO26164.1 hypothetical protein CFE69_09635 [Mycobacteroides abscessus subsp. massiliense]AWG58823.1 hypothetical protein DDT47_07065 [Mycobacteroides abscessus]AWG70230.1 hypothetical protein DDT49_16905 [Mycobacteroides abscessus]PVA66698.1 hypothetical protein DDJ87_11530 [Mycobacteroides abscessus]